MRRMIMPVAALVVAVFASGCGSSSPTAPIPAVVTVSGLTMGSSSDVMKIGTNETFTLTASRSDGSNVAVSGAIWNSDNLAVAIVNGNGLVTPLGSGTATIIVDYQGRRATKLIRVVPDLQGRWAGQWVKTSCVDQTGAGLCGQLTSGGLDMTFTQTRDAIAGQVSIGTAPITITGSISQGGAISLSGSGVISGFNTNITAWSTTTSGGTMTGQFTYVITSSTIPGFLTIGASLSGVTKR